MWLHAVDLDGLDKIPNVLQLNRNKKASFLHSVSNQKLSNFKAFWCWLVCLLVTQVLCLMQTGQNSWHG